MSHCWLGDQEHQGLMWKYMRCPLRGAVRMVHQQLSSSQSTPSAEEEVEEVPPGILDEVAKLLKTPPTPDRPCGCGNAAMLWHGSTDKKSREELEPKWHCDGVDSSLWLISVLYIGPRPTDPYSMQARASETNSGPIWLPKVPGGPRGV